MQCLGLRGGGKFIKDVLWFDWQRQARRRSAAARDAGLNSFDTKSPMFAFVLNSESAHASDAAAAIEPSV